MKLHQLKYVHEVAQQGLNISAAAEALHTSQPGVSKQIQLLEEELGLQIFQRNGKRLVGITEPGRQILKLAAQVMFDMQNIKRVGDEFSRVETGTLSVATTHTQARYKLPSAVQQFIQMFPNVKLTIHQGNPSQVAAQVASGEADIGIATESISLDERLLTLPCYQWNRCLVLPKDHPLAGKKSVSLADIGSYPLITYDFAFTGGTLVSKVFHDAGVTPNIVLTAIDADVIKTYVELGMGIGIIAGMAFDPERDKNLRAIPVGHLFGMNVSRVAIKQGAYLRSYIYTFIELLNPTLTRKMVDNVLQGNKDNYDL